MDSLDRASKMRNHTIENRHTNAIQILEELHNRTKDIPGILTNNQQVINIQLYTLNERQEQEKQQCQQKEQKQRER